MNRSGYCDILFEMKADLRFVVSGKMLSGCEGV